MQNMEKETIRYLKGRKVTFISILVNTCFIFLKLFAGIFGRSSAIIADAIHSLSDLATDIVVILGLKYSTKASDENHPYGHEKIETLISSILGMALAGIGVKIGYDGIKAIFYPPSTSPTVLALLAALLSLAGKEALYRYTFCVGKKINSRLIIANAWHHRSDALSSLVTLVGITGSMIGFRLFDPLAATFLAFFIIKVGIKITGSTFSELVESSAGKELTGKIREIASLTNGVSGVHRIRARYIGSSIMVELHIEVAGDMKVDEAHFIADEVERKIMENIKQVKEVLVHVDPLPGG